MRIQIYLFLYFMLLGTLCPSITPTSTLRSSEYEAAVALPLNPAFPIPGKIEAEDYFDMYGILTEPSSEGAENVGYFDKGDWVEYQLYSAETTTYDITFRVAAIKSTGVFEVLIDQKYVGTINVPATGDYQIWDNVVLKGIRIEEGNHVLRLYAVTELFNINWMDFKKSEMEVTDAILRPIQMIYPLDLRIHSPVLIHWDVQYALLTGSITQYEIQLNGEVIRISTDQVGGKNQLQLPGLKPGGYMSRIRGMYQDSSLTQWSLPLSFTVLP